MSHFDRLVKDQNEAAAFEHRWRAVHKSRRVNVFFARSSTIELLVMVIEGPEELVHDIILFL